MRVGGGREGDKERESGWERTREWVGRSGELGVKGGKREWRGNERREWEGDWKKRMEKETEIREWEKMGGRGEGQACGSSLDTHPGIQSDSKCRIT